VRMIPPNRESRAPGRRDTALSSEVFAASRPVVLESVSAPRPALKT